MKRIRILILIVFSPIMAYGQMFPLSDHYLIDALDINPAFAGCHDALSASSVFRDQWVGFRDAPKSYLLSVHGPVKTDRVGLGMTVSRNSYGIYRETNLLGNYAYRMELENGKLALGLGFGLSVYNIAWKDLVAADQGDTELENLSINTSVLPAFSIGAYYYSADYYIGLSVPLLLSHESDKTTGKYRLSNNLSGSNYFITIGYEAHFNRFLSLMPSLLIKYHPGNKAQIDMNALVNVKDKLWVGGGYRTGKTIAALLQCQLNYQIRLGYTYDYTFGNLGKYINGSHEVSLNYRFRYKMMVPGPRHF